MPDLDDENALFRRMMKDVKPLKEHIHLKAPKYQQPPKIFRKKHEHLIQEKPHLAELADPYEQTITAATILSYQHHPLPHKRFRELKQGQIPKDDFLDLHGCNINKARETLWQFVHKAYAKHHRCVLIIHGKGGQQNEISILKSHVNHWLKQCEPVSAFHSARVQEGGTGAVYVLLKKNRDDID